MLESTGRARREVRLIDRTAAAAAATAACEPATASPRPARLGLAWRRLSLELSQPLPAACRDKNSAASSGYGTLFSSPAKRRFLRDPEHFPPPRAQNPPLLRKRTRKGKIASDRSPQMLGLESVEDLLRKKISYRYLELSQLKKGSGRLIPPPPPPPKSN